MEEKKFYHLFADGSACKNFAICNQDLVAAFNLVGVFAFVSQVDVLAFSIEETHPHFLFYGTKSQCLQFKYLYERSYKKHIIGTRGSLDNVKFILSLLEIDDESYLMSVGSYVICQATKDRKAVMPYDYLYGTGSLYFRRVGVPSIWQFDAHGNMLRTQTIGDIVLRTRHQLLFTKTNVPDDWIMCNGFLLPQNYVKINKFEAIYKTHNCFRVFMSSNKNADNELILKRIDSHGVTIEDLDARRIAENLVKARYGVNGINSLDTVKRIDIALALRQNYKLSLRQIAMVTRIPISELEKYI